LLTPHFRAVALDPVPEPALLGITYPCVLKPLSLSASQGVMRANNRDEFLVAARRLERLLGSPEIRAMRESHLDRILVEEYIPGREVAVEGLLTQGVLRILAIFDKPDPLAGPFFEETIYVTPPRLSEEEQRALGACAQSAVRSLGLLHGPIHAEFRLNERGVWPLEIAPRPIGGLCGRALRFAPCGNSDARLKAVCAGEPASQFKASSNTMHANGSANTAKDLSQKAPTNPLPSAEANAARTNPAESISLEELLVRHALHLPGSDSSREAAASGVMMIPVSQSGTLEKIEGEDAALRTPGVTELTITARLHDYIRAWPEGSSYLGFLFAKAGTPAEVEAALREAHAQLKFTLAPRLTTEHPSTRQLV
jgi:hypothetical protein